MPKRTLAGASQEFDEWTENWVRPVNEGTHLLPIKDRPPTKADLEAYSALIDEVIQKYPASGDVNLNYSHDKRSLRTAALYSLEDVLEQLKNGHLDIGFLVSALHTSSLEPITRHVIDSARKNCRRRRVKTSRNGW
jgi:hypothetical protein